MKETKINFYKNKETGEIIPEATLHIVKDKNKYEQLTEEELQRYYKQLPLFEEELDLTFTDINKVTDELIKVLIDNNIDIDAYDAIKATLDYKFKLVAGPKLNSSEDLNNIKSLASQKVLGQFMNNLYYQAKHPTTNNK